MDVTWLPSPNYAAVPGKRDVRGIVLHDTEGSLEGSLATLRAPGGVSAHYVLGETGAVFQLVDENAAAFHVAAWGGDPHLNRNRPVWLPPYNGRYSAVNAATIGIEIVGYAARGFTPAQYAVLGQLVAAVCARWRLLPSLLPDAGAAATVVTHGWLQTDRTDPGPHFDWNALRAALAAAGAAPPDQGAGDGRTETTDGARMDTGAPLSDDDRAILEVVHDLHANAESVAGWINQIGALEQENRTLHQRLSDAPPQPLPPARKIMHVTLTYEDGSQQVLSV